MKELYIKPAIEVMTFEAEDILTTSMNLGGLSYDVVSDNSINVDSDSIMSVAGQDSTPDYMN